MSTIYSPFVQPETVRLELARGQWVLVKKRLNVKQHREMLTRLIKPGTGTPMNGREAALQLDPAMATVSRAIAYLVDWSFVNPDGTPVVIRGQPTETIAAAIDALDLEAYTELDAAIQTHELAVAADREALKANPFGDAALLATSTSAG